MRFPNESNLRDLKNECEQLLIDKFKKNNIARHNISIEIKGNSNRLNVDLVVCKQNNSSVIALRDKDNEEIIFYPTLDQKRVAYLDKLNNSKYTKLVREFKTARNEYIEHSGDDIKIKSYMIECLLNNIPQRIFRKKYSDDVEIDNLKRFNAALQSLQSRLKDYNNAKNMKELNQKNKLFDNKETYSIIKKFWKCLFHYIKVHIIWALNKIILI